MPEPLFRSVEAVPDLPRPLFLLARAAGVRPGGGGRAGGARRGGFSLLCGRYEGVDQRVADHLVDGELSVGDFVLAGGELAALVVVEAVARLLPDVLGNEDSALGRELRRRAARVPPVHPPGRVPGVGRCPRCSGRGTTGRWPPGGAPRPCCGRPSARPDLIERLVRASALSASDVRALAEHGYDVPSGTEPE